jgi:precorrin-3B synthase
MLSPAAGIDAGASFDVRPLAEQILDVLQTRTALHRLSPKFALQLDGGEDAAMLEHPHDLWLAALPDGEHLAFGLAGCPPLPGSPAPAAGVLSARDVPEFIDIALHLFLACATPGQARMRQLLATMPASEFLSKLQARLSFRLEPASLQWRRSSPRVAAHIGIHAQREPALCYVGAAPALGRIDSAQLRALAALARECGGELRTTPWQSVLLANIPAQLAPRIARALQGIGFECDAGAVLAHTIACSGASGCARGLADTKSDARVLARSLQQHIADRAAGRARPDVPSVHLTGAAAPLPIVRRSHCWPWRRVVMRCSSASKAARTSVASWRRRSMSKRPVR